MHVAKTLPIRRALISVSDKSGLLELAAVLTDAQVHLISTGNTSQALKESGFRVQDVCDVTGFPEILDGRVKTLHPKIHAGLLAKRDQAAHLTTLAEHQIQPIDLVVVNLYPFTANPSLELIDIGGPTMLRAAAKNFPSVAAVSNPSDYPEFIAHFLEHQGTTYEYRKKLAGRVFAQTARLDGAIARYFDDKPETTTLRYGENPHQQAKVFANPRDEIALASEKPLQGKEISYNNLLDADAAVFAIRCLMDGRQKGAGTVIIKHGTPCGGGLGIDSAEAFARALACNPTSAFGGIVAFSGEIDPHCAAAIAEHFFEVILAPRFSQPAREILGKKKSLRLLELPNLMTGQLPKTSVRSVSGGFLLQQHDRPFVGIKECQVVTKRIPTDGEWDALDLAFRLSVAAKSNAIVLAHPAQILAIGAGQTSRVDAAEIAIAKAKLQNFDLSQAALGSDAFLPFADTIHLAGKAGIRAIAQPGGSIRDPEVIEAANQWGMALVFTGERHFRH